MEIRKQLRQTGKSYDLAQAMKLNDKAICIQPTEMSKKFFCQRFNISPDRVFVLEVLLKTELDEPKDIYIDEVGSCLNILLRNKGNIMYGTHTD